MTIVLTERPAVQGNYAVYIMDLFGNLIQAMPNAQVTDITYELNVPETLTFDIPSTAPEIDPAKNGGYNYLAQAGQWEVAVFRGHQAGGSTLVFWGPITEAELGADGDTGAVTQVTCSGLLYYFSKRFFGKAGRLNYMLGIHATNQNPPDVFNYATEFVGGSPATEWAVEGSGITATIVNVAYFESGNPGSAIPAPPSPALGTKVDDNSNYGAATGPLYSTTPGNFLILQCTNSGDNYLRAFVPVQGPLNPMNQQVFIVTGQYFLASTDAGSEDDGLQTPAGPGASQRGLYAGAALPGGTPTSITTYPNGPMVAPLNQGSVEGEWTIFQAEAIVPGTFVDNSHPGYTTTTSALTAAGGPYTSIPIAAATHAWPSGSQIMVWDASDPATDGGFGPNGSMAVAGGPGFLTLSSAVSIGDTSISVDSFTPPPVGFPSGSYVVCPNLLEVRLYCPKGTVFYGGITACTQGSLSNGVGTPTAPLVPTSDQSQTMLQVVEYAQGVYTGGGLNLSDPLKTNLYIIANEATCPATGVFRTEIFSFSDHTAILDALQQFPALIDGPDMEVLFSQQGGELFTLYQDITAGAVITQILLDTTSVDIPASSLLQVGGFGTGSATTVLTVGDTPAGSGPVAVNVILPGGTQTGHGTGIVWGATTDTAGESIYLFPQINREYHTYGNPPVAPQGQIVLTLEEALTSGLTYIDIGVGGISQVIPAGSGFYLTDLSGQHSITHLQANPGDSGIHISPGITCTMNYSIGDTIVIVPLQSANPFPFNTFPFRKGIWKPNLLLTNESVDFNNSNLPTEADDAATQVVEIGDDISGDLGNGAGRYEGGAVNPNIYTGTPPPQGWQDMEIVERAPTGLGTNSLAALAGRRLNLNGGTPFSPVLRVVNDERFIPKYFKNGGYGSVDMNTVSVGDLIPVALKYGWLDLDYSVPYMATLSTQAITIGATNTAILVDALLAAVPSGTTLVLGDPGAGQSVMTSADAAIGDTTINVQSFTAVNTYPIGTSVIWPNGLRVVKLEVYPGGDTESGDQVDVTLNLPVIWNGGSI